MQTIRRFGSVLCLLAGLSLAAPATAAPVWGGTMASEDGIPLIVNPATAPAESRVVTAEEQWRLGGENEDDPLLGRITDVEVADDGTAYLLDSNLSQIHVMSAGGEYLRAIGREGDGPGEFRTAMQMVMLPTGQVGVMEMMPGQIVVIERDGTPAASLVPEGYDGGMRHFQAVAADARGVVVGGINTAMSSDGVTIKRQLARFGPDGKHVVDLRIDESHQTGGSISLGGEDDEFTRFWTLDRDGRTLVYGHSYDYRIDVYGPDGSRERVITRDYESLRRTDEDLAREREQMEEMSSRFGGSVRMQPDEFERDIDRVLTRPDGRYWVATSRGARECPEGSLGWFDELDSEGRLVATVRVEADYDSARDDYVLRGDHLFVLKEAQMTSTTMSAGGGGQMMMVVMGGGGGDDDDDDEAGPFEVVCYRLKR